MKLTFAFVCTVFVLAGCTGLPNNIKPVTGFNANKYVGTWYEIARLDHSFERGLSQVTAEYSFTDKSTLKVVNRGFSKEENAWSEAEGKAKFVKDEQTGHLKVSFFLPFYASYVIFKLDENYEYAFVTGYNHKYLWLLARTPTVSDKVRESFIALAKQKGFKTEQLIFVDHAKRVN